MEHRETEHIVKSYDYELNMLHDAILEMGEHLIIQIKGATKAIIDHDAVLGASVHKNDDTIDLLEQTIVNLSIKMIALRQPMGIDLRMIMAAQRISADLERIGDHAAKAARRVTKMPDGFPGALKTSLQDISDLVVDYLELALNNYQNRNISETRSLWLKDNEIDQLYSKFLKATIKHMINDPESINLCTHIMFLAKNLERMGDYITNILESTHFMVTGTLPRELETNDS